MADLLNELDEPEEREDCLSETKAEMSPVIPATMLSLMNPSAAKRQRASKTAKKSAEKKVGECYITTYK